MRTGGDTPDRSGSQSRQLGPGRRSRRVQINVCELGFNDGAGAGGWTPEEAKSFASWARRYAAALPAGLSLEIEVSDGTTAVLLRRCADVSTPCANPTEHSLGEFGGPVEDELRFGTVLAAVGDATGLSLKLPPKAPAAPVYTIELLRTPSAEAAQRFAAGFETRSIVPDHQLYYSACRPCAVREVKIYTTGKIHQVVIGVFDTAPLAKHALSELTRRHRLHGTVRTLP